MKTLNDLAGAFLFSGIVIALFTTMSASAKRVAPATIQMQETSSPMTEVPTRITFASPNKP